MALTDEQRQKIRDQAKARHANRAQLFQALEAYERALTELIYKLTQENRERHFHPKPGAKAEPLLLPDDIRAQAIKQLTENGINDPAKDAPQKPAKEPKPSASTTQPAN